MLTAEAIKESIGNVVKSKNTLTLSGRITKVIGLILESEGPKAPIGEVCIVRDRNGKEICKSEIVGFRDNKILSMVLGEPKEISPGTEIIATGESLCINVGDKLLGRVLGGLGEPIDSLGDIIGGDRRSIYAQPPDPLKRKRVLEPVATGIRAIDTMLTLGKGQRMGIFSGSGIGKSTLIGMIARNTSADINVIALIGERGREVREFIEKDLQEEGLKRSVVIIAPSDNPPLVRVKGALVATTIAEYFREKGLDVMFMMDSATRLAMAQREVGLAIGEPPTTKGYTPSVFSLLQRTMERAGTSIDGSITALYSVLVEGDDINEPISDASRGILDGHVVLTRRLANLGHYPAIDVLQSISRVRNDVISKEHFNSILKVQELMAAYREAEDLISVGAYQKGTNPVIDKAMALIDRINAFMKQGVYETTEYEEAIGQLVSIASS